MWMYVPSVWIEALPEASMNPRAPAVRNIEAWFGVMVGAATTVGPGGSRRTGAPAGQS